MRGSRTVLGEREGEIPSRHSPDERALRLYRINIALSAELFKGISWLEIALRNALNREMSTQFGPEWYDRHDIGLSLESLRLISNAVRFLTDRRRPVTAGRVVAGLTLGFWVKLLGPGYKTETRSSFGDRRSTALSRT